MRAVKNYLIIDGYNIIFAWDELRLIAGASLSGARDRLIHIMQNFSGYNRYEIIIVFDAHKTSGVGSVETYDNITVVYTTEAVTADEYIERAVASFDKYDRAIVATSDALEQIIIISHGARRLSAPDLYGLVKDTDEKIKRHIQSKPVKNNQLIDILDEEAAKLFEELRRK